MERALELSQALAQSRTRITGPSLQEISIGLRSSPVPVSMFTRFTELRVLELQAYYTEFTSSSIHGNMLGNLHTLRIVQPNESLLNAFSMMGLESLQNLSLPYSTTHSPAVVKFLKAHGSHVLHGKFGHNVHLIDLCKNRIDIEFDDDLGPAQFTCETPHESLTKMTAPGLKDPTTINLDTFDMFPALREIYLLHFTWPTTEREISKSKAVPFAESLLEKNIKLIDKSGKHWVPRVKSVRQRKR
ncbi:hypothetical protein DFH07DRAFT_947635 [Mycena maculata]|uniref:Uncharacterized protein n=1 Tax=Mycena maculata TaxID=230809 RepID=A0AAD7HAU1_9AGAR|nr:hypothetical protein DFH07DRAFT_947635 [Mycena maculata]